MSRAKSRKCQSCGYSEQLHRMGTRTDRHDYTIALAGNPNTGKSTVFNALTGLRQHTGNWPGKTVAHTEGAFKYADRKYRIVDLPGTYSLLSTSEDEEIARNYILFSRPTVTVVVADASRLERNMNLLLQIVEITDRVILCVNLMDEARRHRISIDTRALSRRLGIPVVGTSARSGEGVQELLKTIHEVATGQLAPMPKCRFSLSQEQDSTLYRLENRLQELYEGLPNPRWIALRLLEGDPTIEHYLTTGAITEIATAATLPQSQEIHDLFTLAKQVSQKLGGEFSDSLAESIYSRAGELCADTVSYANDGKRAPLDVRIDRIVTSRRWGFPIMILLLGIVLWLTIIGSNYPSSMLATVLVDGLHPILKGLANQAHFPWWLSGFLVDGVYLATAWVISVMLPPMAIFFPLFTLLEDFGYLPRVAFNLDDMFRRTGAHGKQSLTMCMGFGCNAAGVVSCRIIDSPRERLIAIITNNFSLCNGRWPTQIMIATLFIGATFPASLQGIASVTSVVLIALLGIAFMFLSSWLLSRTVLRGEVSTFHLELPPYRPPQFWQTLYTSLIDRTLIVLWRAILFAAPAGALIWLSCNITIGGESIAMYLIHALDGPGYIMGLNGIILLAYVLAIPANEIVIPTILMLIVLATGSTDLGAGAGVMFEDEAAMQTLFQLNGWTLLTGVNLMLFCLLHNPCSTTIYTIYRETNSWRWTALASLLPLLMGIILCIIVAFVWRLVA
ncbi:MAG: ferrous iron transport protein B [Bacteroidetes bacterium]|nr:MAG: ferrous iron transport protein B [Bacteroidota bacterium]